MILELALFAIGLLFIVAAALVVAADAEQYPSTRTAAVAVVLILGVGALTYLI